MFIGHYKGVSNGKEFYSESRDDLNFPMQVVYQKDRYLLNKTIQVTSQAQMKRVRKMSKDMHIEYDVKID